MAKDYPVSSMTAFGRHEGECELGSFCWELRSVNHRYLDVTVKLPEKLREIEPDVRERIRGSLTRGKCEAQLTLRNGGSADGFQVDLALLEKVKQAATIVQNNVDNAAPLTTQQLLNWPGVLVSSAVDMDALRATLIDGLDAALSQLVEARKGEGARMGSLIEERLKSISELVSGLESNLPAIVAGHQQKLREKLAEFQVELDEDRLAQEVVILAQKSDVAEELDRLHAHVSAVREAMKSGEPCGRRLDFLMQELNREANTLGSKSISTENSNGAINLKVLIEQMREQVQNIE